MDVFLEMKVAWNELGDSDLIVYQIIQGPQKIFFSTAKPSNRAFRPYFHGRNIKKDRNGVSISENYDWKERVTLQASSR